MSGTDVVFTFWNETWTDAVNRKFMPPDRLAQTLFRTPRVGGLLIANPYRSGPRHLARRLLRYAEAPFPNRAKTELLTPLRFRKDEDISEAELRKTYASYDAHVRARSERMGLKRPVVVTTNPYYAAFAPLDWAASVTYYAWDDWCALAALEPWWAALETAYALMAERGTRICAVSETLRRRIAPTGESTVVPNGIVPEEWQPPWKTPEWLEALPAPRLIYVGAIHERLNTDTIREVSQQLPKASIVIVGPVQNPLVIDKLQNLPNVHIHGALPHAEVGGLIHGADVCLMPHHRNALTESMSPLKVYEYCATGRPVVATDLPPVRNVSDHVHLVTEGASFAATIEQALAAPPMTEQNRQAFLARNSWEGRHEQIMDFAFA